MGAIHGHRSGVIRRVAGSTAALVMLAPCLSLAAKSVPDHAPKTGLVVASTIYLVERPFDSAVTLVEAMTRLQQPHPVTASCGGAWRVHFAVQLERPSGQETLDLEFYDVSSAERSAGRTRMFWAEIATNPGDKTIFVNDFVISTDLGFVAGHEYEISVWRPSGSGRRALAKGRFTLGN